MIFLAGVRVHRVEHNVRMDMPPIHMGGNYRLVTVQILRSESLGNFQSQLGRDFTGLEGLDNMVILDAPQMCIRDRITTMNKINTPPATLI